VDTILVTGSSGFIGWRTSEALLAQDYQVVGIDNMNDYYDVSLKQYRLDQLKSHQNFEFYHLDIENFDELRPVFQKHSIKAIINLAARAGVRYSIENPHIYMRTNATGTLNLLEYCKEYEINKFLLASSSSLYAGQKMPFSESLPVNTPISPYAASKKAAEVMGYTYHNLYNIDFCVLRYFTVFGPAGRPDMSIFRFIKWIDEGNPVELFGDGTQSRDFTYVDDIARGSIKALTVRGYEIINLGGGNNPVSINELIAHIEELLNKKARIINKPFHKADMKTTWANIEKAGSLLNWKPETDLKKGLEETVAWYVENRNWLKDVAL